MRQLDFSGMDASKARNHVKHNLMGSGIVEHPALLSFVLMSLGKKPNGSVGWLCNVDALLKYFPDIATFPAEMTGKTYDGPTLFIGGGQSDYLPYVISILLLYLKLVFARGFASVHLNFRIYNIYSVILQVPRLREEPCYDRTEN